MVKMCDLHNTYAIVITVWCTCKCTIAIYINVHKITTTQPLEAIEGTRLIAY